jgi:hypothetical protein
MPKSQFEALPVVAKQLFYDGRPMVLEGKPREQCRLCAGDAGVTASASADVGERAIGEVAVGLNDGGDGLNDGLDETQFDATGKHRAPISHSKVIFRSVGGGGSSGGGDCKGGDGGAAKAWVYIGSHNLSATAWGEAGHCRPNNVELGVVLATTSSAMAQEWRQRMPLVSIGPSYAAKADEVDARAKAKGRGKGNAAIKARDMLSAQPFVRGGSFYVGGFGAEQGTTKFQIECRKQLRKRRCADT